MSSCHTHDDHEQLASITFPRRLTDACRDGDTETVTELLRSGADFINAATALAPDGTPTTPLLIAIMHDRLDVAQLLIDARADLNVACGPTKETALHVSCTRAKAEATKLLIDSGAELNPADKLGRSPLFMAALAGQAECLALMIEAGADLEQVMTIHNPGATPLYAAALAGSVRCVTMLCDAGADVNAATADGATPMMVSCQTGHLDVSMLLSSYGASRQRTVFLGCVPKSESWAYDLAKRSGNEELVLWLEQSIHYSTPLHYIEVLTPARTVALLRSGQYSPLAGGACSPANRAALHPEKASACYILKACEPWSPNLNRLWGKQQRARAYELLKIGYALGAIYGDGDALLDAWVAHVMPHAITWDDCPSSDVRYDQPAALVDRTATGSADAEVEEMDVDLSRGDASATA